MAWFSKLFGGNAAEPKSEASEEYKGFRITPAPIREGGQFRIAARIEKTVDGATRTHQLIRADTTGSVDEAAVTSLAKAKQIIDEQGDGVFR